MDELDTIRERTLSGLARRQQRLRDREEASRMILHAAIRNAHRDGMSTRTIARETSLSHQRIAQILKDGEKLATCPLCERVMLGNGCDTVSQRGFVRIPYGAEKPIEGIELPPICHDCGAPLGGFHHFRCDMEECAVCGGQAISCSCPPI